MCQVNHTGVQQQQQQRFETVTSGKKKKKQKMVRADPSLLGESPAGPGLLLSQAPPPSPAASLAAFVLDLTPDFGFSL